MSDVSDNIETTATGVESATADGISVKRPSLRDQIEADKYLRRIDARTHPERQLNRVQIVPPGSV